MKTYKNFAAIALLLAIASCSPSEQTQTQPSPIQSQNAIGQNNTTTPVAATQRPETKTETIYLEGEPYEVTLQLFDNVAAPFTTYYTPETIIADGGCADEGCGFRFSAKTEQNQPNDAAYLHFFIPSGSPDLVELREMYVTGENSLMANNPTWEQTETTEGSEQYPWVEETVSFFDSQQGAMGRIMLGEHEGQALAAIEFMEGDYGDGFGPRFQTILENLEFKN
jgi:hypothetical protein